MVRTWMSCASWMLLIPCLLALATTAALADVEPNDDHDTSEAMGPGTHLGNLTVPGDGSDCYSFAVGPGQRILVNFSASTATDDLSLSLDDWDNVPRVRLKSTGDEEVSGTFQTCNETGTRTFYIFIHVNTEGGAYRFTLGLRDPDDAGSGEDAREDTGGALDIDPGTGLGGRLGDLDQKDCYRLEVTPGEVIELGFRVPTGDTLWLFLLDGKGTLRDSMSSHDGREVSTAFYTANGTGDGWWFVSVEVQDAGGEYEFDLAFGHQDDAGTGGDAWGQPGTGLDIEAGPMVTGHLEDQDSSDRYRFSVEPGQVVSVDLEATFEEGTVVLDLDGPERPCHRDLSSDTGELETLTFHTSRENGSGPWSLHVHSGGEPVDYQLTLTLTYQDDCGVGADAASDVANASEIATGTPLEGHLEDVDWTDCFGFQMGEGEMVRLNFSTDAEEPFRLQLLRPDGAMVLRLNSSGGDVARDTYMTAAETPTDWFHLIVERGPDPGDYGLRLDVGPQEDGGSEGDAPGTADDAVGIQPGAPLEGCYGGLDQVDWFSFSVGPGKVIVLTYGSPTSTYVPSMTLLDWNRTHILRLEPEGDANVTGTFYTSVENGTNTWSVRLDSGSAKGSYVFRVALMDQDDGGAGADAPRHPSGAIDVEPGETFRGRVEDWDWGDCYRFRAGQGDVISIDFRSFAECEQYLNLRDGAQEWVLGLNTSEAKEGHEEHYTSNETEVGWYYINVGGACDGGEYEFDLLVQRQDDAGSGGDAPGDMAHAIPMEAGKHAGLMGDEDSADWYRVRASPGWTLTVGYSNPLEGALHLEVTDANGTTLHRFNSSGGEAVTATVVVPAYADEGGPLFLRWSFVWWQQGPYSFELGVNTTPVDQAGPVIDVRIPASTRKGKDLEIVGTITDEGEVASAELFYRRAGEGDYRSMNLTRTGDEWSCTVPREHVRKGMMEVFVVARDGAGNEASHGNADEPIPIRVKRPEEGPGFGLALVLPALLAVAAALLAHRRRD